MSAWKPSVSRLTAFFEKDSRMETRQKKAEGNENQSLEYCMNGLGPGRDPASLLGPKATAELQKMVSDLWNELLSHAQEVKPNGTGRVFCTAGENLKEQETVNVEQEVCKRELIAILETAHVVLGNKNGKEGHILSKEQAAINSLQRRLREKSEEARNAREALQLAIKENYGLEYELEHEHKKNEDKRRNISCLFNQVEGECKRLRTENSSLVKTVKNAKADVEQLYAEKNACEVELLRALHKVEMSELVAKQASLQSRKLDEQLKNAETSSRWIHERMEELERDLDEITTILNTSVNDSEQAKTNWVGGQVELLVHKSSKLLSRFAVWDSRDKHGVGRNGDGEEEANLHMTGEYANSNVDEASTPNSGKKWSLGLLSNQRSRNGGRTQPVLLRKITSRVRLEANGERSRSEAHDTRALNAKRTADNDQRVHADGDREADGPSSANSRLPDFKRVFSKGIRAERNRPLPASSDPQKMEFISKTLEVLEKNFGVLQDVFEFKQQEIHHLQYELRDAVKLSNTFEQGMRSEIQKRLEMEKIMAATGRQSAATDILKNSSNGMPPKACRESGVSLMRDN
ncbi:hypothetical protein FGB62_21g441 [Gracilaria domingensis]|nr:hypothetical protein FGB62_21g441 [Gracilaria domingensis]